MIVKHPRTTMMPHEPVPARGGGSLKDVEETLGRLYSPASATSYGSKLRTAAKLLGSRLELLPADPHALRALLERCTWAGHFRGASEAAKQRKFDDLVNRVTGACERYHAALAPVCPEAGSRRAEWDAIEAFVRERENLVSDDGRVFTAMSSLSIANLRGIVGDKLRPVEIATESANAVVPKLRGRALARLRRSVAFFNKLILGQNRYPEIAGLLPAVPVGTILRRRAAPLVWDDYPAGLKASFDAALSAIVRDGAHVRADALAALGAGLNVSEVLARARKAKRIRKPEVARRNYGVALRWLIREAEAAEILGAEEMTDLAVLCRAEVVALLIRHWKDKAAASDTLKCVEETASLHSYLSRLEVVATRALGDPEEAARIAILRITDDAVSNPFVRGMSKDREEFVAHVAASPEAVEALIEAPFALAREAGRRLAEWEGLDRIARMHALRIYVAAMQFGLQMTRPIRPDNLRLLTIDGTDANIRPPLTGRAQAILRLPPAETKNRRRLEHAIPRDVWAILESWLTTWRPRWLEVFGYADGIHLVPGNAASGALSMQSTGSIWNDGAAMIGLPAMTGHMARHACATIYLAAHPGDYETVASLLGDKVETVRAFYGRDSGHEAAARFRAVLERRFPKLFMEMKI
jgi:hypothetical protein